MPERGWYPRTFWGHSYYRISGWTEWQKTVTPCTQYWAQILWAPGARWTGVSIFIFSAWVHDIGKLWMPSCAWFWQGVYHIHFWPGLVFTAQSWLHIPPCFSRILRVSYQGRKGRLPFIPGWPVHRQQSTGIIGYSCQYSRSVSFCSSRQEGRSIIWGKIN